MKLNSTPYYFFSFVVVVWLATKSQHLTSLYSSNLKNSSGNPFLIIHIQSMIMMPGSMQRQQKKKKKKKEKNTPRIYKYGYASNVTHNTKANIFKRYILRPILFNILYGERERKRKQDSAHSNSFRI